MRLGRPTLVLLAAAAVSFAFAIAPQGCSNDYSSAENFDAHDTDTQSDKDATIADGTVMLGDDASEITPDASFDAGADVMAKRVFVSAETFAGNADFDDAGSSICQSLAKDAGLSGTWVSWDSDQFNLHDAIDGVGAGPWMLVDGTFVAARAQLSTPPLTHPINLDQRAAAVIGTVWTGTGPNGAASGYGCNAWSSNSVGVPGTEGDTRFVDAGWTANDMTTCDQLLHVYCFEK